MKYSWYGAFKWASKARAMSHFNTRYQIRLRISSLAVFLIFLSCLYFNFTGCHWFPKGRVAPGCYLVNRFMWYVSFCFLSPPLTVKCFVLLPPSVETVAVGVFPAADMWRAMRPAREEAVKKPHKEGALGWLLFALHTTSFASSLALLVFLPLPHFLSSSYIKLGRPLREGAVSVKTLGFRGH